MLKYKASEVIEIDMTSLASLTNCHLLPMNELLSTSLAVEIQSTLPVWKRIQGYMSHESFSGFISESLCTGNHYPSCGAVV